MHETKDRVDDALHATKAAIEEGIVPGGGKALLDARKAITRSSTGAEIVYRACGKPFEQILVNAGLDASDSRIIANQLDTEDSYWSSYNITSEEVVDFKESGIVDPAKVTRSALENAASVAGTILLTETVIVDEPTDAPAAPGVDPTQFM